MYHLLEALDLAVGATCGSRPPPPTRARSSPRISPPTRATAALPHRRFDDAPRDRLGRRHRRHARQRVRHDRGTTTWLGNRDGRLSGQQPSRRTAGVGGLSHYAPLGSTFIFANCFVGNASSSAGCLLRPPPRRGISSRPPPAVPPRRARTASRRAQVATPRRIKMITNTEIRATPFPRFTLLKQRQESGDLLRRRAGDRAVTSSTDGQAQAEVQRQRRPAPAVGRGEPSSTSTSPTRRMPWRAEPGFPVGIYVSDGWDVLELQWRVLPSPFRHLRWSS